MKTKLIFTLILLCGFLSAHAQHRLEILDSLPDGTVRYANVLSKVKSATIDDSKSFLRNILKTEHGVDFYLLSKETDEIGMTHEKYQQTCHGLKVAFCEYIVHKDQNENIVSINGHYGRLPKDIKRTPKYPFGSALENAIKKKAMKNVTVHKPKERKSVEKFIQQGAQQSDEYELVFIYGTDNQWHLAYKTNLTPGNIMDNFNAYISCETGDLVFEQPMVFKTNAVGTAATRYSGTRNITTDSFNGSFRLREVSRGGSNTAIRTFNFLRNPAAYPNETQAGINSAVDFTDNDNNWTASEYNNANFDNAALDAHWGAETTFDYFRTVHNRNSYDNNNSPIISYVHVRTRNNSGNVVNMDNAFWSDNFNAMFYGDGNWLEPMVCLDICAHELGHGICQATAELVYEKESGAINESLSDIWGACVENWATTNKQTWICGEDLGLPFRSMSNPNLFGQPDTYGGTFWYNLNGCSPNDNNDKCGVHTNSGVGNFWFFLLSQGGSGTNDIGNAYSVTGIGITKAARIVYRAEVSYLTSSANYAQFRNATISAATNLYGANSQEVISVTNAWYAVGVGNFFPPVIAGPSGVCPGTTGVFTANYPHANVGVTWTCSPFLSITPDGNLATVTNNTSLNNSPISSAPSAIPPDSIPNYHPEGWVRAQLAGTGITLERTITVNKNTLEDFNLPATASAQTILIVTATTAVPGIVDWSVSPSTGVSWQQWQNNSMQITFSQSGTYTVQATTTNSCGTFTKEKQITISGGCSTCPPISLYVIAYPNPSADVLNIEVTEEVNNESSLAASTERKPLFLYQLFDDKGNRILRKESSEKKIRFNTSGVPNGIYFIHIQDISGKKSEIAKQTLIIKH
ncbi:MAG: M4 family metallopeptidase [Prevotellaceae bacterium]|jgi:Zn-dependent metalloprotease|nr:M4 family metallopeptidase [Prevotellaceae bacterium]